MKRSFRTIRVHEVMTDAVVTVRAEDALQHALDLFEKHQVHELPVIEGERCVGIMTAGDLKLLTPAYPLFPVQDEIRQVLRELKIASAMTVEPVAIQPEASLLEAVKQLYHNRIESLLVMKDDRLVGVLSISDIWRCVIAQYEPSAQGEINVEDP